MRWWLVVLVLAGCDKRFNYEYCASHPGAYPEYCGLDGSTSDAVLPDTPPGFFRIGGTVTGLSSGGLVLNDNDSDPLQIAGNGTFTFAAAIADGGMYSVTVAMQPSGQSCSAANASGMVMTADVADVEVTCQVTSDVFITCGASTCMVGTQECCHDQTDQTGTCQTSGTGCPNGSGPEFCDDSTNCGGGTNVCCAHINKGGNFQSAVCDTAAAKCKPVGQGSILILCNPMDATPCPGTMMCTADAVRGWNECQ